MTLGLLLHFLIGDMIRDIIIKDDPFIGSKKLLDIPKGVSYIEDDAFGMIAEEFLVRLRDYLGLIREDIPIDWIEGQKQCPEFFISWKHDKEVYGYKIYFTKEGLISSERLFLEKSKEFVLMAEFRNGLPILYNPFWSVGWEGNDLLGFEIPEEPYLTPLMKEPDPLNLILSDIGLSSLLVPEKCDIKHIKELGEDNEKFLKAVLMASDFGEFTISDDWRFYVEGIERTGEDLGSGFEYLSSTLPYMIDARINNATFIDPSPCNSLHPLLETEIWKVVGSVSKNKNWQNLTRFGPKTENKAIQAAKLQSW